MREDLTKRFQARLSAHEKEILQLEAKVKQLREQLELRCKKQDEIVDFRLKQLLREAQGLGWRTDEGAILYKSTQQVDSNVSKALTELAPASSQEEFIRFPDKKPEAPRVGVDGPVP
jgi:multidrug resistance efflux pump